MAVEQGHLKICRYQFFVITSFDSTVRANTFITSSCILEEDICQTLEFALTRPYFKIVCAPIVNYR